MERGRERVRLRQSIYSNGKRVTSIRLRVTARDVPTSAAVLITDIQLQHGERATGVVFNPREVGTTSNRAQYRNGVLAPGLRVVALSNADKATPVRMSVRDASGKVRVGSYRFGDLQGGATVDGPQNTATHGYGRAPIITERQDLTLRTDIENRAHLRLGWNERV